MADIIELLERRDESALDLLRTHYGDYCRAIIQRLLGSDEETEEALSDVWMQVWNAIPPARKTIFKSIPRSSTTHQGGFLFYYGIYAVGNRTIQMQSSGGFIVTAVQRSCMILISSGHIIDLHDHLESMDQFAGFQFVPVDDGDSELGGAVAGCGIAPPG